MIFENANKSLALEFYANARFMGKKYVSYVRGKVIDYNPERINNLLQIIPPEECDVQRRLAECKDWSDEKWDELKAQLCVDGAMWRGGSHMLLRDELHTVAKAWVSFVVQTLGGLTSSRLQRLGRPLWCKLWKAPPALRRFHYRVSILLLL